MTSIIFNQMAILLLLMLVGWVLSKAGKLPDDRALGGYLTNAALPAMIIHAVRVPLSAELLQTVGLAMLGFVVVLGCGAATGFLVGRLARQPAATAATWAATAGFPNVIFMAWPFKYASFGEAALPLLAGTTLVFNLVCFTFGSWLLSRSGREGKRLGLKQLLLQPTILSCFVGAILMFTPVTLPGPALSAIELIAMTTTPVAMVLIGSQLSKSNLRDAFLDGKAYLAAFARLVPAGFVAYFLVSLFIADRMILGFLAIGAFMPTATIIPVIATEQGGDVAFCSRVTVLATIFSVVTLSVILPVLL